MNKTFWKRKNKSSMKIYTNSQKLLTHNQLKTIDSSSMNEWTSTIDSSMAIAWACPSLDCKGGTTKSRITPADTSQMWSGACQSCEQPIHQSRVPVGMPNSASVMRSLSSSTRWCIIIFLIVLNFNFPKHVKNVHWGHMYCPSSLFFSLFSSSI